ncbi:hypothetical protein Tco_1036935, partial [Tanacetum coccineum]
LLKTYSDGTLIDFAGVVQMEPEKIDWPVILLSLKPTKRAEKEGFEISIAKTSFKANIKALPENEGDGIAKVQQLKQSLLNLDKNYAAPNQKDTCMILNLKASSGATRANGKGIAQCAFSGADTWLLQHVIRTL